MKIQNRSPWYIATVPVKNGEVFLLDDMRSALSKTGWSVWARGRNPDRKKFAKSKAQHEHFRDVLPLKFSSLAALYLYQTRRNTPSRINKHKVDFSENRARHIALSVV